MDAYRPQPEEVDVILFKAEQSVAFKGFVVDTFLGWKSLVKGTLWVEVVPGDHLGIIAPPHVEVFAERLRKYLHE
jgi:thioesterase domain-containing protein